MGPNDAIDPVFIVNNYLYNDSLLLTDANSGRFFTIKMDSTNHFQLNGNGFFPDKIYRSSNLNFCDNLIIGRDVTSNQNMFFIYDQNNQSIKEIKYRPFLEGLKANMNYYSATNIAANPERNVIVTAMHHMDLVHLYDFRKHSVNHVFSSPTSIINFTSKKPSYDDTRRSGRDNELLQRAQNDL